MSGSSLRARERLSDALGPSGPLRRVRRHDDADLVFFMPVHRDEALAFAAMGRVRAAYPGSRLIVCSDGDPDFDGARAEHEFGAEYVAGENLYAHEHGGRLCHRFVEHYMRAPARFLVRMDTDARLDRRFAYLPGADGAYGTISRASGTLQGGCVLLTHGAAKRLYESEVFLSNELKDPDASWGRYMMPKSYARKKAKGTVAYDKVLYWGTERLGIPTRRFPDVYSIMDRTPEREEALANENRWVAVVHPDKTMHEGTPA